MASAHPPPHYLIVRCMPSYSSREELSILFPRRLTSNCADTRYALSGVQFCTRNMSSLGGFELVILTLVLARFTHYKYTGTIYDTTGGADGPVQCYGSTRVRAVFWLPGVGISKVQHSGGVRRGVPWNYRYYTVRC